MDEIKRQLIAGINNYKEVREELFLDASLNEEESLVVGKLQEVTTPAISDA